MTKTLPRTRLPNRQSDLLYKEIAFELRRRITDETYPPGGKIPGLNELVKEFGVSTITVRRALRELTYEGLLYSQQGLGVFIKPRRKIHRLLAGDAKKSIGDEIRRAGFEPHFHETAFREEQADAATAERLHVRAGKTIHRHEKIILVDDEVVSHHTLHIPPKIVKKLRDGLTHDYIFQLLKERKIAYASMRFEFASGVIDQELSLTFRLPVGFPLLYVYYTPTDADGVPLLTGVTVCRADMFVFEIDIPEGSKRSGAAKR